MAYIGNTNTTQTFVQGTDYFNGDGSTVAFTLSRPVVTVNDIEVFVNNVAQQPSSAYTVSGSTLTMTGAPSSGTNNVYVRYMSTIQLTNMPAALSVTNAQLAPGTAVANIGYTPLNKAGDTSTGTITVIGSSGSSMSMAIQAAASSNNDIHLKDSTGTSKWLITHRPATDSNDFWIYNPATGSSAIKIGAATNYVTKPNNPAFVAVCTSGYTGTTNAVIVFGTVQTNIGSCYNSSNGRFTAPISGMYSFAANIRFTNVSYYSWTWTLNGAVFRYSENVGTGGASSTNNGYSINVYLNANDYVSIFQGSQGGLASDSYASFSGFLIG